MPYRDADLERSADEARRARALDDEVERQVAAMRSPIHALMARVPHRLARAAPVAAAISFALPLACVVFAPWFGSPRSLRDILAWGDFVSGGAGGLTTIALGVVALVTQTKARLLNVLAILAGVCALPYALVCAVLVDWFW